MEYEFTQEMIDAAVKAEAEWRENGQQGSVWAAVFKAMLAEAEAQKAPKTAKAKS